MTELLTAAEMRAVERAVIDRGAVTGLELMERAGRAVVAAIFAQWPDLAPSWGPAPKPPEFSGQDEGGKHHAVVLCGPGNNGGDGFVIARLLRDAGWQVAVFLYGDAAKLPPDARVNAVRWGETCALDDHCLAQIADASLVVDALFGTGLARPLRGLGAVLQALHDRVDQGAGPVVAVDLPSGLCADSGRVLRGGADDAAQCGKADLTVAFHAAKCGHYLEDGPRHCGGLVVADIGLADPVPGAVKRIVAPTVPLGKGAGHKYSHGHALVLSGGVGKGGAARLAARGALRVGAGAVTLGCPPAALIENAAQLNAIMLRKVRDADALVEILQDKRFNALCIGPGLGTGPREAALVSGACAHAPYLVLDADALTLLAQDAALFVKLHANCVLTPHAGEFARLFPDLAEKLDAPAVMGPAYSKVDATRDAARRAGCVVLFKGPDTVIADPSGRCCINASVYERHAPWLATAGSGDVLAGVLTGLLARGVAPMQAAETAAWLHTQTALSFGSGLIAEDLPEALPQVFRALGL